MSYIWGFLENTECSVLGAVSIKYPYSLTSVHYNTIMVSVLLGVWVRSDFSSVGHLVVQGLQLLNGINWLLVFVNHILFDLRNGDGSHYLSTALTFHSTTQS